MIDVSSISELSSALTKNPDCLTVALVQPDFVMDLLSELDSLRVENENLKRSLNEKYQLINENMALRDKIRTAESVSGLKLL